jgi:hypothetical protein
VIANFLGLTLIGLVVRPIAEWWFSWPAADGGGAQTYLLLPSDNGDVEPGFLLGLLLTAVVPALAGAFAGGATSARLAKTRPILIGVISALPVAVALVAYGEYAPGGEAISWMVSLLSPVVAALGVVVMRRWWGART